MRKLVLCVVVALALAAPATAQTWFWRLTGGIDPLSVLTSEGNAAWTYNGGDPNAYWESVPTTGGDTALRIVDNSTTGKPRWDGTADGWKNDVSPGMTIAFRIKGEAALGTTTIMQFANHLLGAATQNKLALKIGPSGSDVVITNGDRASTPGVVVSGSWHEFWAKMWVNGGSVHFQLYWDGTLWDEYDRTSSTAGSKFGVDSSGNTATYQLDYLAYSLDGAWDPGQLPGFQDYAITSGPSIAYPDESSATITWTTSAPDASSEVHYGTDPSCSTVIVEPGGGGKTDHSVTVPLPPNVLHYYFVKSTHATLGSAESGVKTALHYATATTLQNPAFDTGQLAPWTKFQDCNGIQAGWSVPARSPSFWAGSVASGDPGARHLGGVYQKVLTTTGNYYEATAWIWTRRQSSDPTHPSKPLDVAGRVGIDPMGGTDPTAPSVVWSAWAESDNACTDNGNPNYGGPGGPWKKTGAAIKAKGPEATVFLQQQMLWGLEWNIVGFDDTSFGAWTGGPPTTVAGTRALPDGYPAQLSGKVVTCVKTIGVPGSETKFVYVEDADRAAGIKVNVPLETTVSVGNTLAFDGTVTTVNGEKQVMAETAVASAGGTLPRTLGVTNRALAMSFGHTGPNNQGLLVKAWGRVTESFYDATLGYSVIYIDDGTGYHDGAPDAYDQPGIRVCTTEDIYIDDYVQVTGCAGNYFWMDTADPPVAHLMPVIWANSVTTE